jgi:hypothetical protein
MMSITAKPQRPSHVMLAADDTMESHWYPSKGGGQSPTSIAYCPCAHIPTVPQQTATVGHGFHADETFPFRTNQTADDAMLPETSHRTSHLGGFSDSDSLNKNGQLINGSKVIINGQTFILQAIEPVESTNSTPKPALSSSSSCRRGLKRRRELTFENDMGDLFPHSFERYLYRQSLVKFDDKFIQASIRKAQQKFVVNNRAMNVAAGCSSATQIDPDGYPAILRCSSKFNRLQEVRKITAKRRFDNVDSRRKQKNIRSLTARPERCKTYYMDTIFE